MNNQSSVKYTGLNNQIMKFLLVGGSTFILDYIIMISLIELFNTNYLLSTAIGFIVGSILNYYLSIKFVFVSGKFKKYETEFSVFMIFTILGLGLNHLIMYSGCDLLTWDYKIVKILSLLLVTAFNFITKKIFVFIK